MDASDFESNARCPCEVTILLRETSIGHPLIVRGVVEVDRESIHKARTVQSLPELGYSCGVSVG